MKDRTRCITSEVNGDTGEIGQIEFGTGERNSLSAGRQGGHGADQVASDEAARSGYPNGVQSMSRHVIWP